MDKSLIPVILAGGKGERFWPLSRKHRPKQFLSLDGSDKSLLQATADRLNQLAGGWQNVWVITSAQLADGVQEQLPQLPPENVLAEPEGRDTAPAVAWATLEIAQKYGDDAVVGFFPADHWIADQHAFQETIAAATELAIAQAAIVTLGIAPDYPSTGYGYIEQGQQTGTFGKLPVYRVNRFTEKPDRETAEAFLATGNYSWNSGMFIFRAGVVLAELNTYAPEIIIPLQQSGVAAYSQMPKKSIDYALMEKTQLAYVLPAAFGWDDLGDWNALERLQKGDAPNVELATHVGKDTQGSVIYATDKDEVIVTIGLEDVVVVRDRNATLIVKKDRTQEIKQVLKTLQDDPNLKQFL
ncbi:MULTISPECIES: mannose-1-phosphate guanylyltransferase [unclassified Coleofasciculus]|uniref:mannose-1-phosphate guanylyltransferase n=1 Tax=unclassified Coleofasciculus TaxID=2692782 RepID=UPI00187F73A0|nr:MULTISPECIES: mannose-1-phosphate guanylyltransferase [unclassified Coleofasciculus]MBE9127216.1 mannose-1-phosphate guanylyltransferase [Coleofasciculus sp. LEGE 07081]MBE9150508.1 mannose-1-phosphate guanylyltransferase [Coleofasciculus sp. LEGE 07092]